MDKFITENTSVRDFHHAIRVVLNAGDALFIPEGLWHQVTSSDHTIAVSYWFDSAIPILISPII